MSDDMTEEVHRTLAKVGDFLKKAKPEHLKSLLNDEARLEIVPTGWKVSPPPAPKPPSRARTKSPQPSAQVVEDQLRVMSTTSEAADLLAGMGLNVTQMRKLATELGLRGVSKMQADEVAELIVRTFVGARLDSEALERL